VLALLEDGRLKLDDPVERFLPELAGRKVLSGGTGGTPRLVDPVRPPTLHDLLTHTAGYSCPDDAPAPLLPFWRQAAVFAAADLDDFVARVATVPLAEQPGTAFRYGVSTDLLGAVVQRASGMSFEAFLAERITGPLGMADTGFWISEEQRGRLALIHQRGPGGGLVLEGPINAERPQAERGLRCGGGGLFSTAPDYARFAQALLQGGALDGARVLSRKSVELMTCDHLRGLADPHPFQRRWLGYGLCVRVTGDLGQSPTLGSPGAFGWDGLTTTMVEIAPREELVGILLYQHLPWNEGDVFATFFNGMYAALEG
jgi:CubicO group peptidase (beta-lactamase class C family)